MAVVRRTSPAPGAMAAYPPRQAQSPDDEPTQLLTPDETTVSSMAGGATSGEMAASAPSKPAHLWAVLLGLGFAVAGGGSAAAVGGVMEQPTLEMSGQMSVWASLFAFAAVVERVLEPFTRWLPGRAAQRRYDMAVAAMSNGAPGAMAAAARAKADVAQARADRTFLSWGLATGAAAALAAASGFYLLRMVVADPAWSAIPMWVDALISGVVVGSGTKPVHDLISRMQRSNEQGSDSAA